MINIIKKLGNAFEHIEEDFQVGLIAKTRLEILRRSILENFVF